MLRIETRTKKRPEEVINKAIDFFVNQYGLELKNKGDLYAELEGAGGGVRVEASWEGNESRVEFLSREWDTQVKEFIAQLTGRAVSEPEERVESPKLPQY